MEGENKYWEIIKSEASIAMCPTVTEKIEYQSWLRVGGVLQQLERGNLMFMATTMEIN